MDWGEEDGDTPPANEGARLAGTAEELFVDNEFIWFSCF